MRDAPAHGAYICPVCDFVNGVAERVRSDEIRRDGFTMPEFSVSRIATPDDDPNFRKMKEQYTEQYLLVRQADKAA